MSARRRKGGSKPVKVMGTVIDVLPGALYRVQLEQGSEIVAYASAKRSKLYSTISPGDQVRVELFSYDPRRGRIVSRRKRWIVNEPVRSFLKRLLAKNPQ